MAASAWQLLKSAREELAPGEHENRLVPLIARGTASREALAALAAEQHRIIASDWRSFLVLASRSDDPHAGGFFLDLAQGEVLALEKLDQFAAACGVGEEDLRVYKPRAGCQAYPSYLAWLALNGEPSDVVLAVVANFSAWGSYCKTVAQALRVHYGFDDAGCAFFDFFAAPPPGGDEPALAVVQAGLDAGRGTDKALEYGCLLQDYELMFWNTLAELA
jgi:TENA/THI-4/PQQC family protein